MSRRAFTLIELLVVLGILGLLAAIIFPVFAHVRENGRRTTCLSNLHQLGLGLQMYAHDNEDTFPAGTHGGRHIILYPNRGQQESGGNGMGWAGEVYPYVKSTAAFACPDDTPVSSTTAYIRGLEGVNLSPTGVPVSYGYNNTLVEAPPVPSIPRTDGKIDRIGQPSGTMLLFEITGDTVDVTRPDEGASQGYTLFSATGDGRELGSALAELDKDGTRSTLRVRGVLYATGRFVGTPDRPPGNPEDSSDLFTEGDGRHNGGANFLLADGHAKWLPPAKVCSTAIPIRFPETECTAHF